MNYSMQGMMKKIHELFMMMKSMKVEIKKEHQVLMVDKITSFKKRAKGKKGKLQVEWQTSCHSREEDQSLKLSAYTAKEMVTGSGTPLNTWRIRRMAK